MHEPDAVLGVIFAHADGADGVLDQMAFEPLFAKWFRARKAQFGQRLHARVDDQTARRPHALLALKKAQDVPGIDPGRAEKVKAAPGAVNFVGPTHALKRPQRYQVAQEGAPRDAGRLEGVVSLPVQARCKQPQAVWKDVVNA